MRVIYICCSRCEPLGIGSITNSSPKPSQSTPFSAGCSLLFVSTCCTLQIAMSEWPDQAASDNSLWGVWRWRSRGKKSLKIVGVFRSYPWIWICDYLLHPCLSTPCPSPSFWRNPPGQHFCVCFCDFFSTVKTFQELLGYNLVRSCFFHLNTCNGPLIKGNFLWMFFPSLVFPPV